MSDVVVKRKKRGVQVTLSQKTTKKKKKKDVDHSYLAMDGG